MAERLAGALVGDAFGFDAGGADRVGNGAPCVGELVLVIGPARRVRDCDRAVRRSRAEALFDPGFARHRIRRPGRRRLAARRRTAPGDITMAARLHGALRRLRAGAGY